MDWAGIKALILEYIRNYRYLFLLLLLGIFILINPIPKKSSTPPSTGENTIKHQITDLQTELEELLSRMEGAGRVKVLLTESLGEEICYQTDEDIRSSDAAKDVRRETVIITTESRAQQGLVLRIDPPVYMGAVVLCQGADSASVRLSIVEAVKSVTGLPSNKITVIKMK